MVQRSYYRAIWISDIHLGTRACKASALLDFLRHHIAETLYLVGDIVDGWNWGPSWHWSVEQQELVNEIVRWRRSVNVVFLPGNHDEAQVGLVEGLWAHRHQDFLGSHHCRRRSDAGHPWASVRWLAQSESSAADDWIKVYARGQRIHDWYNRRCEAGDDEGRSLSDYIRNPARRAIEFLTDFRDRAVLAPRATQGRRRHLRPYSSLGPSKDRKRHLCERRRLGAKSDGAGRGAGRRAANHSMAGSRQNVSVYDTNVAGGECMTLNPRSTNPEAQLDLIYFDAGGGHRASATALISAARQQHRSWHINPINLRELLKPADVIRRLTGVRIEDFYNSQLKSADHRHRPDAADNADADSATRAEDDQAAGAPLAAFAAGPGGLDDPEFQSRDSRRPARRGRDRRRSETPMVTILTDMADYPPHFWIERQPQYLICGTQRRDQACNSAMRPIMFFAPPA